MVNITQRTKLIVGIDYGTTYSGISYALSNASDFQDIVTWTKYPGAASHSAEHTVKAPTRVAFPEEKNLGIEEIGKITYTLSEQDWSGFPVQRIMKNGVTYTRIYFVLSIRLDDEVGHLVFRILCNNIEVGKAELDLEDE